MSDDVNTTATYGQTDGEKEEEPIIVAQRFLNIFRQLHIFSQERRDIFNQMALDLPPSVRSIFKTLPGGGVLIDYLNEIEKGGVADPSTKSDKSSSNQPHILQEAVAENKEHQQSMATTGIISDNFAQILADSLAQSNAQIIRELQNNRPQSSANSKQISGNGGDSSPLKIVADETFSQSIAAALSKAIASSEQKRQEDNKIIAQSFLDMQENLNKMMEQNNQLKIISNSENPGELASAFQFKSVVDDLVKAQSNFLKESTQKQKEELSSIISVAIKESLKLSTQSLIDSFKKMENGNGPAPITYASGSPKQSSQFANVEEALKAQGREFSAIIATALKESQQNSAQTIAKTLETMKSNGGKGNNNSLSVEDVMKMQADLLRDIARTQNQEFSTLISTALQESQKQSTQAIITALAKMQERSGGYHIHNYTGTVTDPDADLYGQPLESSLQPNPIMTPTKNYEIESESAEEEAGDSVEDSNELSSKKKKKKKKKNRDNQNNTLTNAISGAIPKLANSIIKSAATVMPTMPAVEDKAEDTADDWGFVAYNKPETTQPKVIEPPEVESTSDNSEDEQDWNWEYQAEEDSSESDNEVSSETGDNDGEGEDWEWDYEEVPEGAEGTEGEDWEWDYEEVPDDDESAEADNGFVLPASHRGEIVLPDFFELCLSGIEDDNYKDPYLENNDNIG